MLVKFVSDFHAEFWPQGNLVKFERILSKYLPITPLDKQTILCCAGDMGTYSTYPNSYKPLFKLLGERFKHVIMTPGNHSWYNTAGIWGNEKKFWEDKKIPKNVHYLNNDYFIVDGVVFICSCLWTSFDDLSALSMFHAARSMNDFECIKVRNYEVNGVYGTVINSGKLTPEASVTEHYNAITFIQSALAMFPDKKRVVITHHAPSSLSVSEMFRGDLLNAAYYTDLSEVILNYEPVIWQHGHMHDSKDYTIGNTRIICNPLGYHAVQINRQFDPNLIVEL